MESENQERQVATPEGRAVTLYHPTPKLVIRSRDWRPTRLNFYRCGSGTGGERTIVLDELDLSLSPISEMCITALAFRVRPNVSLGMYKKIKLCRVLAMYAVWRPCVWWWCVHNSLSY